MFFSKSHNNHTKKTILTAPLDWGLGHATRCIPIIKELNAAGHTVIIAADGAIKTLLQEEFPDNTFIKLQRYDIRYARSAFWLPIKLIFQLPKALISIVKEHYWLRKTILKYNIDMVISDNRFGLFNSNIFSVYITHQLNIKTGNSTLDKLASRIHRWFIMKYNECWVPDFESDAIAGELSHPSIIPSNVKYIGCLSRFERSENLTKAYDLLIIISGPEPQRSIFENIILKQSKACTSKILIIRGLPGNENIYKNKQELEQNIVLKNYVKGSELALLIQQSELVICRSGYSSVMDLIKLKQKAILVPTPGQPEQNYLSKYLFKEKLFYFQKQEKLILEKAILESKDFSYKIPDLNMNEYAGMIIETISDQHTRKL